MSRLLPRLGAAALLTLTAAFATACSADEPAPEETTASAAPSSAPSDDGAAPAESEAPAEPVEVTCETIIPESTVADFASIGWTYQEQPFYVGERELTDGILCVWADYEGVAGDHLQMYGWGPIDAADADAAETELVAGGWIREDGAEGVYITENPDTTIAVDDDGYGMTYLFGDGWVTFADTKQGLLLIERPAA